MHVCASRTKTRSSLIALGCGLQATSFLRSPSWRFTPAGVIGVLSNRYERLESIARGNVDSTWLFVNACLPLFFLSLSLFNSTSIIDSQTTNDNRFSCQGIALHTRRIFFSSNQRREDITRSPLIGKIAFDRLACFTVSFFFFSLFRNYYSGHLALIRVLVQRVFPRLSFYLFSVMEFNASAVAKCAAQSESRYA